MGSLLTVTVAATERKLTTAAALRADLGVSSTEASDARLEDLILRASRAIESYCGRVFAKETLSEVFRCPRGHVLPLTRYPVVTLTSVTEDGTALSASAYETDTAAGRLYRLSSDARICWSAAKVTVVYDAGFILPPTGGSTLPPDIEAAALKLAAGFYFGAARDPLVKGESADGIGSVDYWVGGMPGASGELPPDVLALLAPYRTLFV